MKTTLLIILLQPRGGGGGEEGWGYLGQFSLGMCGWPFRTPSPRVIIYFMANCRPHLSHFWLNVILATPT